MAINVSDDGSALVDFNLSSTIDDSVTKRTGRKEKCSLCNNLRKTFYCKACVLNGDFVSSNPQNPERYADKKLVWMKLKNDKEELSNKCVKAFEKMEVKIRLQTEIDQCRGRINLLMQLIKKKNEVIKKTDKELETIKEKNSAKVLRLPRNKERVEKLEYYVAYNMKAEIKQRRYKVAKAELELKKIVQKNVEDLINYIFPICKIDATLKSCEEVESTDTVSALAEATRTSYVRGKWVFMDSSGDLHYRIVAPTLPGSGDYSAYSDWVAANKNGVPVNEKMDENQAYSISAALCYTTQLSSEEKKIKSQELNSQVLFESQEIKFHKLSEVQSSHSTNVGELEDVLLQELGRAYCASDANSEEADSFPKYDLRTRKVKKHYNSTQTSDLSVSKKPKLKIKKKESETRHFSPNWAENTEMAECSQESVSMLQECYEKTPTTKEFPELMETSIQPEFDVINIYSDDEEDSNARGTDESWKGTTSGVERSTQTEDVVLQIELALPRELEMAKHADFINSIVKLKAILSSRKSVRVIPSRGFGEETRKSSKVGTSPRLYRSSDAENVFRETVEVILMYLENVLRENLSKIARFWKGSVYEVAIEMLNEAFDNEAAVRKMIEKFLFRIIRSILKDEEKLKNLMLESKTMVAIGFCRSAHLSYAAIDYIIRKLAIIKTIRLTDEDTSVAEKLSFSRITKSSYFVLRMLESFLESFKAKLAEGKKEDAATEQPEENFNVLEMWRRHRHRNEVPSKQTKEHECGTAVNRWCKELDEICLHCLNRVPVLSTAVERCGELSKEIFMTHYQSAAVKNKRKVAFGAETLVGDAESETDS